MKKLLALVLLWPLLAFGYLTDDSVHAPLASGTQNYNSNPFTDLPSTVGNCYTDAIFGTDVCRVTAIGGTANASNESYAFHACNANGTLCFHEHSSGGLRLIDPVDGSIDYTNQPQGTGAAEYRWHMTDSDKYYFFSGTSLMVRNVAAQTSTTVRNFTSTCGGSSLEAMGGSVNYWDRDNRRTVFECNNLVYVWDSVEDVVYSNPMTRLQENGWVGITPDGNYVLNISGPENTPNEAHYSHALNHTTNSISTSAVNFWGLCGGHGVLLSASDGKNYWVGPNCHQGFPGEEWGLWRVDITLDVGGSSFAVQTAANQPILQFYSTVTDVHMGAVTVGELGDWMVAATEDSTDDCNDSVSGWVVHKQELIAVNVVTLERRRLAHHRSRPGTNYQNAPRPSFTPSGTLITFMSNMNDCSPQNLGNGTGYADMFAIFDPVGVADEPSQIDFYMPLFIRP